MLNVHPTYPPPRGVKFISSLWIKKYIPDSKFLKILKDNQEMKCPCILRATGKSKLKMAE